MSGSITWLGHAAFRFDTPAGDRIYVDPWLTGNPSCPASELEPERVDAILVTHGHNDHVGDAVRLARAFACPVIAQVELRGVLGAEIGEDMGQSVNKGGGVDLLGRARDADAREPLVVVRGRRYTGESCGFVVELAGMPTLYFAGDTNVFGDMALIRRIYAPDVAVLPIGDHFTMGPREAAVAAELLGAPRVIAEPLRDLRAADRHARGAPRAAPRRHRARRARRRARRSSCDPPGAVVRRDGPQGPRARSRRHDRRHGSARARRRQRASRRCGLPTPTAIPVVVHADSVEEITAALARPEVSCVLVADESLLALDLADLTYG